MLFKRDESELREDVLVSICTAKENGMVGSLASRVRPFQVTQGGSQECCSQTVQCTVKVRGGQPGRATERFAKRKGNSTDTKI